ncbi:MAG: L,D-transpeptidase family protein [Candidatus Kuenenia sp.]|nr:L,D-transpeptidase family protein [Candidatus Kuenenia hertensis]
MYKKDIIVSSDDLKNDKRKTSNNKEPVNEKKDRLNIGIINEYLKEGKNYEVRNYLSEIFLNKKIPEKQNEIKELLDELNSELIFSVKPSEDAVMYTVQSGDTLTRIAKQFNTNYELIVRINKKPDSRINVGERLKILKGKIKVLISKNEFTLTLLLNDHYVKQYRIGTGRNNKTPEGAFEVKNKMKNPTWYSPYGGVYPYGDEKNILGTRWVGFKEKENLAGFGIHGTTLPESIGTASSDGCVRMKNEDVEEVYDFITSDTEIIIQK